MKRLLIAYLLLVFVFYLFSKSENRVIDHTNKYIKEIKDFIKNSKQNKYILLNEAESYKKGVNDNWIIFKGEEKDAWAFEFAHVWLKKNSIVLSRFFLSSPSQDWVLTVNYYFKMDKLIFIESRLATFYGSVIELKKIYYDTKGLEIKSEKKLLDIVSKKPIKKKDQEYMGVEFEIYGEVKDLPFYKTINKNIKISAPDPVKRGR